MARYGFRYPKMDPKLQSLLRHCALELWVPLLEAEVPKAKRRKARPDSETRKKRRLEAEERKLPAAVPSVSPRDEGHAENKRKKRPKVRKRKRGPRLDRDEAETESKINQYKSRLFNGGGGWFDAVDGDK